MTSDFSDLDAPALVSAELRRQGVNAIGYGPPVGYERYVRILHPMNSGDDVDEAMMTWRTVAQMGSIDIGARTTWADVMAGIDARTARQPWFAFDLEPVPSTLPRAQCAALLRRLASVSTSSRCIFGTWDGYADLDRGVASAPHVDVVGRTTCVFVRPISVDVPDTTDRESPLRRFRAPNLWLAADRQWLVTTELYSLDTILAGTTSVIAAVKAESRLEVVDVDHSDLKFVS